jgi:ADP-heptose:LPS heptosyltransferase
VVTRTLVVRLDSMGDVLVCGPAVRAVAGEGGPVTVLAGPQGADAAELLPGVHEVLRWSCPWIAAAPPPVDRGDVQRLVACLDGRGFDRALVLTSFHQSPLPTALLLRLAGIGWVGAISDDYPGSLLDLRHRVEPMLPEPERALSLAEAAGYRLPPGDDGGLAVRPGLPDVSPLVGDDPFVVLHPGTSVEARAWPAEHFAELAARLVAGGRRVVVTGAPGERALTGRVASAAGAVDLGGRTDLAHLAAVLDRADVVVVGNTGPAHLAAAVRTPVVSLFAPTVPARRWAPYGVPSVVLGDQDAACRGTRATRCPVPGHPCLSSVEPIEVVRAVEELATRTAPVLAGPRGEEIR